MVAKHIGLAAAALALAACAPSDDAPDPAVPPAVAGFVGGEACAGCHQQQWQDWQGSHHDLAMQPATPASVLGDFDDARFEGDATTTRFFRRGDTYVAATAGADGAVTEFEIAWTFGVTPLQQYLIALDNGRVQALSIAWDSRPAADGGQRWFDLYPDETIDYQDPLHWTGVYQRWNTMCADCHSTDLHKDYDVESDTFATRFSDVDVACEACHGPGSVHATDPSQPLPALPARQQRWSFAPGASIASLSEGVPTDSEIEVCAQCHSRRAQLTDDHSPGDSLFDAYRPALLEPDLYHADGQIESEVYVYGSFLQSAMYAAGVTCSDCHEPHSATLRAEGNTLCAQCHLASTYDQPGHHHHAAGTTAAECTSCHMRAETYMVVDPRRDHSFRVPRPDLSATVDSPNACSDCHAEQGADWAAERVAEWYPQGRQTQPHYGEVLQAARTWQVRAHAELLQLISDPEQPVIVRATAVRHLAERMTIDDAPVFASALDSGEPLLQLAAIDAAAGFDTRRRVDLIQRFLTDDALALRTAAARALLPARDLLSARRQADLDRALDEYLQVQQFNSDRAEGLLNSAGVALDQGRYAAAESLLDEGIQRHPDFPALYVNLADLYRLTGRETEAEQMLRAGLEVIPDAPALKLALGYALVRGGRMDDALPLFRSAAELAPGQPDYAFVLAIAESDANGLDAALAELREAAARFPGHPDILFGLATMLRDAGQPAAARTVAGTLAEVMPGDQRAAQLLAELDGL